MTNRKSSLTSKGGRLLPNYLHIGLDRKNFLKLTGLGLIGSMLPGLHGCGRSGGAYTPPRLSMQLYTIRNAMELDTPGSLSRLADIGFTHVETAFWPDGSTHEQGAEMMRRAGLKASSSHVDIPEGGNMQPLLDLARLYDTDMLIWHGWPEDPRYGSIEGTREMLAEFNEVSSFLRRHGLRFGLHNHWWEFMQRPDNRIAYQVLHEEMDPDIFFQIDTYWVAVAGLDPASVIQELGSRVASLHIKDGPAQYTDDIGQVPHPSMTAVGQGALDFASIADAAKAHVEWNVIEADEFDGDVFRMLEDSLNYMIQNNYAVV